MLDGFGPLPISEAEPSISARRRIAVVGSGIAGLSAAWLLAGRHDVELYEAACRLGGHSNTVDVTVDGRTVPVDMGFIVYNERNYPNLTRLFATLGVESDGSCMSFSVSIDGGRMEYCGGNGIRGLFAQPRNLVRLEFWRMLRDIARFFADVRSTEADAWLAGLTVAEFLADRRYSRVFADDHLLPMAAAIWSGPVRSMLSFPALTFIRFFRNHGLLQFRARPRWRTVAGGSRRYVERMALRLDGKIRLASPVTLIGRHADGIAVESRGVVRHYDDVVVATHADQALAVLDKPRNEERRLLGAFCYRRNRAVLHRDRTHMPRRRAAWSSWNYRADGAGDHELPVSVTYWMNRLQRLRDAPDIFLSLNPAHWPDPKFVIREIEYDHPIFDTTAVAAQRELRQLQGRGGLWYCGSYFGNGFHEDALVSAMGIAEALGVRAPWAVQSEQPLASLIPASVE